MASCRHRGGLADDRISYVPAIDAAAVNRTRQDAIKVKQNQSGDSLESRDFRDRGDDRRDAGEDGGRKVLVARVTRTEGTVFSA